MAVEWATYARGTERDGGHSAAIADGGHDGPYAAIRTLDYWEALYEPPWDIGWDRVQGAGTRPPQYPSRIGEEEWRQCYPPAATTPAAESGNPALQRLAAQQRLGAQVRTQRVARRWTQGQLARCLGVGAAAISRLECKGAIGWSALLAERCFRVLADPGACPPPAPAAAPERPRPPISAAQYEAVWRPVLNEMAERKQRQAPPPPDYTCNGCRRPSWLHGPRPAPGCYTVHCNDCDAYTLIEVG